MRGDVYGPLDSYLRKMSIYGSGFIQYEYRHGEGQRPNAFGTPGIEKSSIYHRIDIILWNHMVLY